MNSTPVAHLSIVIPLYNGRRHVTRALESLSDLVSEKLVEVVVVDDGSTDGGSEVVKGFAGVNLVHQANGGVCKARNVGLGLATGRRVMFLDQDDWVDPTLLRRCLTRTDLAPAVYWECTHWSERDDGVGQTWKSGYGDHSKNMIRALARQCFLITPGCYMVETELARILEGFDARYSSAGEDYDYLFRVSHRVPWSYVSDHVLQRLDHESTTSRTFLEMYENGIKIATRHAPDYDSERAEQARQFLEHMSATARSSLKSMWQKKRFDPRWIRYLLGGFVRHPRFLATFIRTAWKR